jgi:hypothetical protein
MRMRNALGLAAGVLALLAVGSAFAQDSKRDEGKAKGRSRGEQAKQIERLRWAPEEVREVALLRSPRVREELKLTEEQGEKIRKAGRAVAEKHRDEFRQARETEGRERGKRLAAVIRTASEDMKKELDEILRPQQSKRLEQLALQFAGPRALVEREFREKLKLTDDQEKRLREIAREFGRSARDLREDDEDRDEARQKYVSLWRETVQKVAGVLTSEQKAKWKELAGEPFHFDIHPGRPEDRDDDRTPGEGRGRGERRKEN